jgi:cephalosporin hydroxylase
MIRDLHSRVVARSAGEKFKEASSRCRSIEEYVDLAFSFTPYFMSINPLQVREEIIQLMKFLARIRPKVICEIGTAAGGTLFLLSRVYSPEATIVSIDLSAYPRSRDIFFQSLVLPTQELYLIRGDSHDFKTLEKVKKKLNGRSIDFLLIDGDHSYKGVKSDFEMYSQFVKEKGIIAFHDIVPHSSETKCEVYRFWQGIKKNFNYLEIVKDWGQGTCGFGLIFKEGENYYEKK